MLTPRLRPGFPPGPFFPVGASVLTPVSFGVSALTSCDGSAGFGESLPTAEGVEGPDEDLDPADLEVDFVCGKDASRELGSLITTVLVCFLPPRPLDGVDDIFDRLC
jgi:hypothetical protein